MPRAALCASRGDLKPDNIFLMYPYGEAVTPVSPPATVQVKIVDFGIAKLRESASRVSLGIQGNMGMRRT